MMTPEEWKLHNDAINEYHNDVNQQTITWINNVGTVDPNGEDGNYKSYKIDLLGLVQYNVFRSWPIDQASDSGEIDKQSCMVFFNKKYLRDLGYINQFDQFEFNPDYDRFIINNVRYMPAGDSDVAQAQGDTLMVFIILKREQTRTGSSKYPIT